MSLSLSVPPSAADEEKLDERAKLSVAAKRTLFRVSFDYRLFVLMLTDSGEMCSKSNQIFTVTV